MIFAAMKRDWILFLLTISILFAACGKLNVYEKKISFSQQQWAGNNRLNFDFDITDSSKNYYNFYIIVRHTEKYNYNNIWISLTLVPPRDTSQNLRLNIPLATGNSWLGTAMDDVYEQRILVNKSPIQLKPGVRIEKVIQ